MAKPDTCPLCGEGYRWRVPARYDGLMRLAAHYRCRTKAYVYLHRIDYTPYQERATEA